MNVSIIIVAKRSDKIKLCLTSLLKQSLRPCEIIVLWQGNSSFFRDLQQTYKAEHRIKIILSKCKTIGEARNKGTSVAKCDVIGYTDDDCIPSSDWLKCLTTKLSTDDNIAGVGSIRDVANANNYFAKLWQLSYIRIGDMSRKYKSFTTNNIYLCTSSAIFRKSCLNSVGGFDEGLISGEDSEISLRLRAKGYRLLLEPQALIKHYHPINLSGMIKQQTWYGIGDSQVAIKYRKNKFYVVLNKVLFGIIIKTCYAFIYSIKKRSFKLTLILPSYILIMETSRLIGYIKGNLSKNISF